MSDHTVPRALYSGSHGTAAAVHQDLSFVKTTDSALLRLCVWAVIPVNLGSRDEHIHNLELKV